MGWRGMLSVLTLSLSFFRYMYELLGLRESFKVKGKDANTGTRPPASIYEIYSRLGTAMAEEQNKSKKSYRTWLVSATKVWVKKKNSKSRVVNAQRTLEFWGKVCYVCKCAHVSVYVSPSACVCVCVWWPLVLDWAGLCSYGKTTLQHQHPIKSSRYTNRKTGLAMQEKSSKWLHVTKAIEPIDKDIKLETVNYTLCVQRVGGGTKDRRRNTRKTQIKLKWRRWRLRRCARWDDSADLVADTMPCEQQTLFKVDHRGKAVRTNRKAGGGHWPRQSSVLCGGTTAVTHPQKTGQEGQLL